MQTNRPSARKGAKFLDTKILIAASSLGITISLWNLFSHDALQAQIAASKPQPAPPENNAQLDLPPMPTLAPVIQLAQPAAQQNSPSNVSTASNPSTPLRSVSGSSSPVVVQKFKPVVDLPQPVSAPGGGGGGSKPAATTKSSR